MEGKNVESDSPFSQLSVDPKAFLCVECNKPLTIPVFQCENGHTICSSCCAKKCLACSSDGCYKRCKTIEKVLELVKIACRFQNLGCKEMIRYTDKYKHEKACKHAPHTCPFIGCNFMPSFENLLQHVSSKHFALLFHLDKSFSVELKPGTSFSVLREDKGNVFFALHRREESLGSSIWVSQVSPAGSWLDFKSTVAVRGRSGDLTMTATCIEGRVDDVDLPAEFLFVPLSFLRTPGEIDVRLTIGRKINVFGDYVSAQLRSV